MSETNGNGIFRIGEEGRLKVAFGDRPAFEIDVLQVNTAWHVIDAAFRGPDGKVPDERSQELNDALYSFVLGISADTIKDSDLNLTMAVRFIKHVSDEAKRLKDFFENRSSEKPSSPERTELTFSE